MSAAALPEVGDTKLLGRIRLLAQWVRDWAMLRTWTTIDLPVLSAKDYDALPEDDDVAAFVQWADSDDARVSQHLSGQVDC